MIKSYELSYTAKDIDEKLGKIDELESAISGLSSGVGESTTGKEYTIEFQDPNTNELVTLTQVASPGAEVFNSYDDGPITTPNKAVGPVSHAEGAGTTAFGPASHAEGSGTTAFGEVAHAEGVMTKAYGPNSHTEGQGTTTLFGAGYAHAEGEFTTAHGRAVHAEGEYTNAIGEASHAEGLYTRAAGRASHAEGSGNGSIATISLTGPAGSNTYTYTGDAVLVENRLSIKEGMILSISNKQFAVVIGHDVSNHSISLSNTLSADEDLANTIVMIMPGAGGEFSHVEGNRTIAFGRAAHAEGYDTTAAGHASHAEGINSIAHGSSSHTEGGNTIASGSCSHAEGFGTTATGDTSHAEGRETQSTGEASHTEGKYTQAIGGYSHAEGYGETSTITLTGEANATQYTHTGYWSCIRGAVLSLGDISTVILDHDNHNNIIYVGYPLSTEALVDTKVNISYGVAYGWAAHSEGEMCSAAGDYSHAEGFFTAAVGAIAHAEGYAATAAGTLSHAEGGSTNAYGDYSHAEGSQTTSAAPYAHAEGFNTMAFGESSHAEGSSSITPVSCDIHITGPANSVEYTYTGDPVISGNRLSVQEGTILFVRGQRAVVTSHDPESHTITVSNTLSAYTDLVNVGGVYAFSGAGGEASHAEGYNTFAYGNYSHAEGRNTVASSYDSHAEGCETVASAAAAHAEGLYTTASGDESHAEGDRTTASGWASHAEGYYTEASGKYSHAEGAYTSAYGDYSHAEGNGAAIGKYSHAEGISYIGTVTLEGEAGATVYNYSDCSVYQMSGIILTDDGVSASIVETDTNNSTVTLSNTLSDENFSGTVRFCMNCAAGDYSHAEGIFTRAFGFGSHAEGYYADASGEASHAEGFGTFATGAYSHAEGYGTAADSAGQHAQGWLNIADTSNQYLHIVGNGDPETWTPSNAHTLDWSGNAVFAGTVSAPGADYAEHFEWLDGNPNNEDRVGMIVTLEGDKIRPAMADDEILGVVSGTAMVIGDNAEWEWQGKFLTDTHGRVITEMVEEFVEIKDPETGEVKEKKSVGFIKRRKLNPEWDATKEYTRRADRPEWDVIGLFGKLYVNDDGTCVVGGWATNGNDGKATASTTKTNMRVMKRITDDVILVFMK